MFNRGMRACAVEMLFCINFIKIILSYGSLQVMAVAQNLGQHFVRACAVGALFLRFSIAKKMQLNRPRAVLCASLRSRNACQHYFTRLKFRKFTGTQPQTRVSTPIKPRHLKGMWMSVTVLSGMVCHQEPSNQSMTRQGL